MKSRKYCFSKILTKMLVIIFVINVLFAQSSIAMDKSVARISYSINGSVKIGQTIEIMVNVSNVQNLYGASVDFIYDPSLLQIESVDMGNIFSDTNGKVYVNSKDSGRLSIAMGLTGDVSGISKSGTLAVIRAKVMNRGIINFITTTSNSELLYNGNTSRVKLATENSSSIEYVAEDMSMELGGFIPAKIESVLTDKPSPRIPDANINVTVNTSGSTETLYKFWIKEKNDKEWKIGQDYSRNNEFLWCPTKTGEYLISVYVKDINSDQEQDDFEIIEYSIVEPTPASINNISVNKKSPRPIGTEIEISAESSGSAEPLYKFWVKKKNDENWSVLQEYSHKNKFVWKPLETGDYKISVYVKDNKSNLELDDFRVIDYTVEKPIPAVVENVTFSRNTPQAIGNDIDVTVKASGGENIMYEFWVKEKNDSDWTLTQSYSRNNKFTWSPKKIGEYKISVYVKDMYSSNYVDNIKISDYTIKEYIPAEIVSVDVSKKSPQAIGTSIDINVNAKGDNILYQYWIKERNDVDWTLVKPYSNSNTFNWTPNKIGDYSISVYAKDAKSNKEVDSLKIIEFSIKQFIPAEINSISFSKVSPQPLGQTIDVNVIASGGEDIIYQFWVKEKNDTDWTLAQKYSRNNRFTWKPTKKGEYSISVYVRDSKSSNEVDNMKVIPYIIK